MKQNKTQDEFYKDFEKNATPDDIKEIDEKLEGMNKGPITAIGVIFKFYIS